MPSWKENQDAKAALAGRGFHTAVDKWPPRVDYYWHKDGLNYDGVVVKNRGAWAARASSDLQTMTRNANKGWWIKPPTDDCECTWCKQWRREQADRAPLQPVGEAEAEGLMCNADAPQALACPDCDYIATGTPKQQPIRMSFHQKKHKKAAEKMAEAAA